MSTDILSEPCTALEFASRPYGEHVTAFDIVNALVGVTSALDFGCVGVDEEFDRNRDAGLATAARLLAQELQSRLSEAPTPARRRPKPRLVDVAS